MNGMSFVVGYGQKQPKNEQAAAAAAKRITPPDEPDERTRRRIRRTNTRSVNRLRRWLPLFGWVVPFFSLSLVLGRSFVGVVCASYPVSWFANNNNNCAACARCLHQCRVVC